jgi:hypothetical protein
VFTHTGYGLDDRGSRVRFPAGAGNFSLHRVQNGSEAHPASYPMGSMGSFQGVKLTTHLYLVPSHRMRGAIPPLPQYVFMAWCLVKHRDNFTFTFSPFPQYKRYSLILQSCCSTNHFNSRYLVLYGCEYWRPSKEQTRNWRRQSGS